MKASALLVAVALAAVGCKQPGMYVGRTGVTFRTYAIPWTDTSLVLDRVYTCMRKQFDTGTALTLMEFWLEVYPQGGAIESRRARGTHYHTYAGLYEPIQLGFYSVPGIHVIQLGASTLDSAFVHEFVHHILAKVYNKSGMADCKASRECHTDEFWDLEDQLRDCLRAP